MNAALEIELKLAVPPEQFSRLRDHLAGVAGMPPSPAQDLKSIYYDTADRALAAQGIALRVRQKQGRFIQTLKTSGGSGLGGLARGEWEVPGVSFVPDLDAFPQRLLQLPEDVTLTALYATQVSRETLMLRLGEADIEVALDWGEITSGTRSLPISEIELEVKSGNGDNLFAFARDLREVADVRFDAQSKGEKGHHLSTGSPWPGVKAGKPSFSKKNSVSDGLALALGDCFTQWTANEAAVLDGRNSEGVHQMRVGLRRFRSGLSIFRPLLRQDTLDWLRDEARWAAGQLGPARDWDVFLEETLGGALRSQGGMGGFPALRQQAAALHAESYSMARNLVRSDRYARFVLEVGAWLEARDWEGAPYELVRKTLQAPIRTYADGLLTKRYKKLLKQGKHFADMPMEERHLVRIEAKKLRYGVDFFRTLYNEDKLKPFRKKMTALQEALGQLNDQVVAGQLCEQLAARARPGSVVPAAADRLLAWLEDSNGLKDGATTALWKDFTKAKPFWE